MIEIIQYKGKPILKITSNDIKYLKVMIGLKKAKLIVSEIETIKDFILKNQKEERKEDDTKTEVIT